MRRGIRGSLNLRFGVGFGPLESTCAPDPGAVIAGADMAWLVQAKDRVKSRSGWSRHHRNTAAGYTIPTGFLPLRTSSGLTVSARYRQSTPSTGCSARKKSSSSGQALTQGSCGQV